MSPILAAFLKTAAAPAALVALGVFLTGRWPEAMKARVQGLIIAAGFFVGNYLLMEPSGLVPASVGEAVGAGALLLALFVMIFPRPHQAPYLVRAVFVAALGGLVLWSLKDQLNTYVHKRNLAAFFFLGLGVWSIYERKIQSVNLLSLIGLPLIAVTGLSFILLFGASAKFSQMAAILCTILGGLMAIALVAPGRLAKASVVPFLSAFVIAMMAAGHFQLDINPWKMVFLCVPFLIIWIRDWFKFVPNNPVIEFIFLAVMALIPLGYLLYNSFVEAGPLY